ncbi:RTA1 like protein-domain-containing protein [Gloeopeniophorella convolvens]|nr:RTA1 like protein-domain-containing protein [Gloeopeniophorella convolvens]
MRRKQLVFSLLVLCLLAEALPAAAKLHRQQPPPADPFLDPKNDPYNPLGYIASNTLTGIAFGLVLAVALAQTFSLFKWGAWWMMCMTIGAYTFALGIGCRFGLHVQPESQGIYIVEYLFIILSPCAFIAANYVLLGRLARFLNSGNHLLVSPNRITITFLISDIITFLIQATGGSVSVASDTTKGAKLGSNIFLGALVIQLLSFLAFTLVFIRFMLRVRKYEHDAWVLHQGRPWYNNWLALAGAMAVSCVGIIIRSFYRVVELSQGFLGPIAQNEGLFYALDTLPLFLAISVYVPIWPGRFIARPSLAAPGSTVSTPEPGPEKEKEKEKEEHAVNVQEHYSNVEV